MTPSQINIAIAQGCGWKNVKRRSLGYIRGITGEYGVGVRGDRPIPKQIPNYYGDLNACHSACLTLTDSQGNEFDRILWHLTNGRRWTATAAERAEAFLKVKGIWKGDGG